ncbi:putative membrane protein [Arthrobacter sp. CAN_A6]|uniref:YidH family protein n=1 Tax=Arthrobacter sp. CAN_A6 TaxID=2787721 RepID=UPI0018CB97B3
MRSTSASGSEAGRGRLSATLLGGGTEPDPRFTLANERTFLAWIRTALALLAGGIAVEAFTVDVLDPEIRKTVAVLLLLLSMVIAGGACFRWVRVERAMRRKAPLPIPLLIPFLALAGALVSAVFVVFVLLRGN